MELSLEHRGAAHCENGTISALMRFHGIDLSEPMIFGLSRGLYFTHLPFVKLGGLPVTSFRYLPGVFFTRITKTLGIEAKMRRFLSRRRAMEKLDSILEEGKPVGCVVGMYYLPYLPKEYRFHFNGHNICVIGKDETLRQYAVLDSNTTQKVYLGARDMERVRFAKGGAYPLFGQMYWIEKVPGKMPDFKPLILRAIRKTCRAMLCPPPLVHNLGIKGMYFLSRRIRLWEKKMGTHKALMNLAQLVRMLEEIGTGGAGFRFLYGAFLQEASIVTGISELQDFSVRITGIGDMWRNFSLQSSRKFKKRASSDITFERLGDMVKDIADAEKMFFTDLYKVVERYL